MPDVQTIELPPASEAFASSPPIVESFEPPLEQMRRALVLGLGDYVEKNGFAQAVVAVSGGIDSAVTATLCTQALGPERVHCVSMPSRYSSEGTRADARRLAENLGCSFPGSSRSSRSSRRTTTRSAASKASRPRTCRRACAACC